MIDEIISQFEIESNHQVNKLTSNDLSYMAGIVDGEGSIYIGRRNNETKSYWACFKLATTDKIIVPWFCEKLELNYTVLDNGDGNKNIRRLLINGKSGIALMIKLYPFLKLKKKQAEIYIRLIYLQHFSTNRNTAFQFTQENLYTEMKNLNRKGSDGQ